MAMFVIIYVVLYSRQAAAREKAQRLLAELEVANRRLTEYAERIEDLTLATERQRMARELGAKVVSLTDRNVSDALVRYAQQENISHVVFGQSARSRWNIFLHGSIINRFLSEVRDATVQVVPMNKPLRRG